MLYFTNEIMKQRVSGLGEEHRKLYKFFSDYYRELNTAPLIEDMVLEMRAASKELQSGERTLFIQAKSSV